MKNLNLLLCCVSLLGIAACNSNDDDVIPSASEETSQELPTETPEDADKTPFSLSHEFGVYASAITLKIGKANPSNIVYYCTDGSLATTKSQIFPEAGLDIRSSTSANNYILTPKVISYDGGWYNYGYVDKGVCISFLEMSQAGDTIDQRRGTYIVNSSIAQSNIPVVCLSAPISDWLGKDYNSGLYNTYPDIDNDKKYRGWLEFYDLKSGEQFSLNTQMKRGGNWTRKMPCRTINLNFNKNEFGDKDAIPTLDIFDNHERMDGSGTTAGDINRFRLHSGGNACFSSIISDAFVHKLVGNRTNVSTTAWRPCLLYLNAEYWGLYQMREHYCDEYFKTNYGVKKSEVMYVDKVYSGKATDAAYSRYRFEIKDGDEAEVLAALDDLFQFLGYDYKKAPTTQAKYWDTSGWELTGAGTKYAEFCERVDVASLIDLILIQGYCANWDFMYNNLRMWRTRSVDPSNPYADGKWRFCLQDVDFAFEDATADNELKADDGTMGDGLWNSHQLSYLDYYAGNAYLNNGSVTGYLKPYNYLILYLPMQNPEFKALVKERAEYIQNLFNTSDCESLWNEMINEIDPYVRDRATRWGGYWNYNTWKNDLNYRLWRIQNRHTYFMAQVKKAFGI